MAVPQNTVNKQTCTPWNDLDPFTQYVAANGNDDHYGSDEPAVVEKDTQTEDGNLSPCGFNDKPEIVFQFVNSTDDVHDNVKMADVSAEWVAIPEAGGGCEDDSLPDTSIAIWGDAFGALPSQPSDVSTGISEPGQNRQTQGSNGMAVDPFIQGGSTSGGGFSDNFCEMTETDLIFRSGLVDEEFKTICVTAEEDDLWSSCPQGEESTAWANHSGTHESWDPFPANQHPFEPFPANQQPAVNGLTLGAVQSEANLSTSDDNQTDQLLSVQHQTEITSDVLIPKVPIPLQSDSTKHSNSTVLPLEGKTSVLSNQPSANSNAQSGIGALGTSSSIEMSGSQPQNVGQKLNDATFRDSILDGPWMAEVDCLESKAFTVDLNKNPLNQDVEVKSPNMDLLSDQAVLDQSNQIDQNNLWKSNNEGISLPPSADVNANKEANGKILFGDTCSQDPKAVVAPPPEFDSSLEPLTDKAEPNSTLVFANSDQINGNVNIQFDLQGNSDKGNDRGRTSSDLDRFLNELGDGTVIDDEVTGNGSSQSPNEEEGMKRILEEDPEKEDAKIERGQSPSDVLRLLNDLGDGTAVDEEVRQIDGVQSPSDVLKLLNELGDGTIVDDEINLIITNEGQTLNNVDKAQNNLEDVMIGEDCSKQIDRAENLGDGDHVLNGVGDAMVVGKHDEQIDRSEAPSDVYHVPSEFGDSIIVDEQDKQAERPETEGVMDLAQNNLEDGFTYEQDKDINRAEAPSDVVHVPKEFGDSITMDDQGNQIDIPEAKTDEDHIHNEAGDLTTVGENETQTNKEQLLIDVDQVPKDFEEDTEPAVVKLTDRGRSQSEVERLLNELGDGTMVDEEDDSLTASKMENGDNLDSLGREEDQLLEKVGEGSTPPEPSGQEGILAVSTDEAWDEIVRESSVALQESVPDESSNLNGLLEGDEDINTQTTEAPQDDKEVAVERSTTAEINTKEPEVSETNIKLDLNAKRRSFFGDEDVNVTDASFQPTITDKPPSSPVVSVNLSSALPSVPVLPKVQTAYHRPESFYETKPRAATDSFLSSHALLGLGGDQAITTDTKSRSASEPPPSSIIGVEPETETSDGMISPRSKDPSIEAKSTKFIRALYGPKPGSKASELVDEDGKTLFEYEQERRNVLSAMKVKRKKKVNWQRDDSQSEDLATPGTGEPLSQANRKDIKLHSEPQSLKSKESPDISVESPLAQKTASEFCPENVVQSHMTKEDKPQFAPAKISPEPQSTLREDTTSVRSTKPPSKIEDILTKEDDTEKKKMPSPCVECQSDVSKATPKVQEQPKASLDESQAEGREEETPADMKKIRSLWEQKASAETGKEGDKQMSKKSQPRRMFSFEDKAKVDAVKKEESQNDPRANTQETLKIDTSDAMPRDVDDVFDRCESYTYEVNPERKVTIQSHRTTESIIEQDIRIQREREQEFHKQGPRSSSDQGAKEQLAKPDHDVRANESVQQSQKLDGSTSNIKSPSSAAIQSGPKSSPAALRQNLRATPVKWAESEIKQESVQAQESLPGNNSEAVMIIKDKEEPSKSDSDARGDEPQRKESIVQREIRLQKERDEQNALERQKALEETRLRRASFDSSSQSSQSDSGRSTPVRIPQSPVKLSPTSTPNKPSSPPTGSSGFTPIKPSLLPSGLKTADSSPSVTKPKDKSAPVVRFGLSSMQTTQYSSYREYQRMLRGRKTSESTSDKPVPMKATGAVKQPVAVDLKDSPAKEQAQQRPPSPVLRRSHSPVFNRPPSPYQSTSPVANPVDPAVKDSSESKPETAVQREIRLAKEREAQLQEERLATNTALKKDYNVDVTDVVIVEKPQDTDGASEGSQVTERSKTGSSPQPKVVMRKRETPMERDIRLNEEREMMLRKEREETLSPMKRRLHTQTETLLEREIRLEREREEQYRLEKGILSPTSPRGAVEGADGGTQGVTDSVGKADTSSAEATKPKYRPQRRSLVLAQQWEQMFK